MAEPHILITQALAIRVVKVVGLPSSAVDADTAKSEIMPSVQEFISKGTSRGKVSRDNCTYRAASCQFVTRPSYSKLNCIENCDTRVRYAIAQLQHRAMGVQGKGCPPSHDHGSMKVHISRPENSRHQANAPRRKSQLEEGNAYIKTCAKATFAS